MIKNDSTVDGWNENKENSQWTADRLTKLNFDFELKILLEVNFTLIWAFFFHSIVAAPATSFNLNLFLSLRALTVPSTRCVPMVRKCYYSRGENVDGTDGKKTLWNETQFAVVQS